MRRMITVLVLGTLLTCLGCNTVKGAGKDIQEGGKAVENAAEAAEK
ncbi:MAG: entericidin A/B family lipoprotein [Candidatus Hydrogenedentes bacterium]|nr:entericidin A/B family lipoprotein [Candidatus Hydrogenedentota bacterium]